MVSAITLEFSKLTSASANSAESMGFLSSIGIRMWTAGQNRQTRFRSGYSQMVGKQEVVGFLPVFP